MLNQQGRKLTYNTVTGTLLGGSLGYLAGGVPAALYLGYQGYHLGKNEDDKLKKN